MEASFESLKRVSKTLSKLFAAKKMDGYRDLKRNEYICWGILQHYGISDTPLLDITHSLRVACSFAQLKNLTNECFVYVFGLPYVTNRISANSEHDIINIRLLSICPPDALRPYFQEGYLSCTWNITTEYDNKTDLDFKNRLIAKFRIPNTKAFWGRGFSAIPEQVLYPKGDKVENLCKNLKLEILKKAPKKFDFSTIIRKVVHNFGFSYYSGHPQFPKGEYDYIVKSRSGKTYIIVSKYFSTQKGPNFPSEQIEKYFDQANNLKHPLILISTAPLTPKASQVIEEFNKEHKKKRMIYICGDTVEQIIEELKQNVS